MRKRFIGFYSNEEILEILEIVKGVENGSVEGKTVPKDFLKATINVKGYSLSFTWKKKNVTKVTIRKAKQVINL